MTGPHADVAAARLAVRTALTDLAPGDVVLVACSGGPDSIALAAATAFVAPRLGLRAGAVCVDHGLQAGSAVVADGAATTCRELALDPVTVARVEVRAAGGPEAAARTARYEALDGAARDAGAAAVLLGHTLDDQAETVLLGLARGSGARALSGMSPRRGRYRRPFLHLRRAQTDAACRALELATWADPTNLDVTKHRRAAVRHDVLPVLERTLGPGVAPALARTADLLRADADALDALAAEVLEAAVVARGPGRVELAVEALDSALPALRSRALRAAALAAGVPAGDLAAVHVEALTDLVTRWHGQGPLDLPGGVAASRAYGRLSLRVITSPT